MRPNGGASTGCAPPRSRTRTRTPRAGHLPGTRVAPGTSPWTKVQEFMTRISAPGGPGAPGGSPRRCRRRRRARRADELAHPRTDPQGGLPRVLGQLREDGAHRLGQREASRARPRLGAPDQLVVEPQGQLRLHDVRLQANCTSPPDGRPRSGVLPVAGRRPGARRSRGWAAGTPDAARPVGPAPDPSAARRPRRGARPLRRSDLRSARPQVPSLFPPPPPARRRRTRAPESGATDSPPAFPSAGPAGPVVVGGIKTRRDLCSAGGGDGAGAALGTGSFSTTRAPGPAAPDARPRRRVPGGDRGHRRPPRRSPAPSWLRHPTEAGVGVPEVDRLDRPTASAAPPAPPAGGCRCPGGSESATTCTTVAGASPARTGERPAVRASTRQSSRTAPPACRASRTAVSRV